MTADQILAWVAVSGPAVLLASFLWLAFRIAAGFPPSNRAVVDTTAVALSWAFLASAATLAGMLSLGLEVLVLHAGTWFRIGSYRFELVFLVDHLTVPFMILASSMCAVIGRFSMRYLRGDSGHHRFFLLLLLFSCGMLLMVEAGSVDLLFAGWEMLGITSALLISFFQERKTPVQAGLTAFAVYRLCDVGLFTAAVLLHILAHDATFPALFGERGWSAATSPLTGQAATLVSAALILAALGKSAQIPFSGWLPRAMEGPTPSSALFYGALSVHAGAYLLLRHAPLLAASPWASRGLVVIGILTAVHAIFVGRVQTEVKTSLAYASMCQSGLIFAEIGLGYRYLALAHVVGHACLRGLQFLRSPSYLQQYEHVVTLTGGQPVQVGIQAESLLPRPLRERLYAVALARGFHEELVSRYLVGPLFALAARLDSVERTVVAWMGRSSRDAEGDAP